MNNKYFIAGDALMNMFYPTVSMLYHNKNDLLESARKISRLGNRIIYLLNSVAGNMPLIADNKRILEQKNLS